MSDEKLEQAIFKIFRMTHEGALKWEMRPVPALWSRGTDSVFPVYFETNYQGRKMALFQERRRRVPSALNLGGFLPDAANEWSQSFRLALLGENDEIVFDFPHSHQLKGLFDAVRYKESNIDEFLDVLLNTESIEIQK